MARIDDYKESFRLASEELKEANPHRVAKLGGADIDLDDRGRPRIKVPFFNREHVVTIGDKIDVVCTNDSKEVPLPEKIVILHYLLRADGSKLTGNLINFRQIPDGHFYYSAFQKRATDPLRLTFGGNPKALLDCGIELGATPSKYGDYSIRVGVLPRVPLILVVWKGDDEFPPEASILFDDSIVNYLPVEDIAVISGMTVYRLMGIRRKLMTGDNKK